MGLEVLLAGASLAATVVGGVTSAIGAKQTAAAQQQSAVYQSQVAANNAIVSQQKAAVQEQTGQQEAVTQGRKVAQALGQQRAALAAAGVDVNSGTALDVQEGTSMTGRMDELTLYNNAMEKAFGYSTDAANYRNQANLSIMQGNAAEKAGDINATSSIISSASSFGSKWSGFARTGAVPSFNGMLD